jgi:hypothetical protein
MNFGFCEADCFVENNKAPWFPIGFLGAFLLIENFCYLCAVICFIQH